MAAEVSIRIKNLPQIRAAFARAPMLMTRELNLAIKRVAFAVAAQSSINAPVRTGFLRRSHFLPGAVVLTNLRGTIEPTATYAIYVHQGTRFMRGRPFLLQAVKAKEPTIDAEFTGAVQRVLDKIGGLT